MRDDRLGLDGVEPRESFDGNRLLDRAQRDLRDRGQLASRRTFPGGVLGTIAGGMAGAFLGGTIFSLVADRGVAGLDAAGLLIAWPVRECC
jgi:hypothetical protein